MKVWAPSESMKLSYGVGAYWGDMFQFSQRGYFFSACEFQWPPDLYVKINK